MVEVLVLLLMVVVVLQGRKWGMVLGKGVEIGLVLLPLPAVKMKSKGRTTMMMDEEEKNLLID